MKRIVYFLTAGMVMMSCNEAEKTTESTSNNATTTASVSANTSTAPNTTNVQTPAIDTAQLTKIEWLDGTDRNFGKIKEGEKLNVAFRFKNTGNKPLIISEVKAGCGCTAADKPAKPFAPGETGEIKASFDSQGRAGTQSKYVDVVANIDPQTTRLVFNVEVKPKKS